MKRLERMDHTTPSPLEEEMVASPLRLTLNVLLFLRQQVVKELYRHSKPTPREERTIESGVAAKELLIVENARSFAKAIQWAVGEFADLLTQTVTARARISDISKTVRVAIWEESLKFGEGLASEGVWSEWLENGKFPLLLLREGGWTEGEKQTFFQRVRFSRNEWLWEADRRIDVRLILCGTRLTAKRVERRRREIAKLMYDNRESSDHELCLKIDSINEASHSRKNELTFPVPDFLEKLKLRLWADAFGADRPQTAQRMYVYLSKIRKEFRVP
jgi:hypothetical protein